MSDIIVTITPSPAIAATISTITAITGTDPVFSASEAALFVTGDKSKLDAIEANATAAGASGDAHAGIITGNPHNTIASDVGALPNTLHGLTDAEYNWVYGQLPASTYMTSGAETIDKTTLDLNGHPAYLDLITHFGKGSSPSVRLDSSAFTEGESVRILEVDQTSFTIELGIGYIQTIPIIQVASEAEVGSQGFGQYKLGVAGSYYLYSGSFGDYVVLMKSGSNWVLTQQSFINFMSGQLAWDKVDKTGAIASQISFTPSGNIAATNVQAAIEELDTEKAAIGSIDMFASLANAENSITGAATAVVNKMNVCSGTTADYALTLPTPSAGAVIGIRISPACTKLITVDAGTGKTVNGVDQSKIMWASESVVLLGVDANTWVAVATHLIPMAVKMRLASATPSAAQSIAHVTSTKVLLNTIDVQCNGMANSSTNSITIKRGGRYSISSVLYCNSGIILYRLINSIFVDSQQHFATEITTANTSSYGCAIANTNTNLTVGAVITLYALQQNSANVSTYLYGGATGAACILALEEIPTW